MPYFKHYFIERKSFGAPIAKTQMIQHKIADMAVKIESARLLNYQAAVLKDNKMVSWSAVWKIHCYKRSVKMSSAPNSTIEMRQYKLIFRWTPSKHA